MAAHAFSMGPGGDFSALELGLEVSNSISSEISSSRRDHGDGAEGTARAQKKRKVRTPWSEENTPQLLRAYRKRKDEKGRSIMREVDWQSISESVEGMAGKDCQRRMDTLTKSFNKIKKHCAASHKQFSQLTEGEKRSLKLATKMEADWYYLLCEIKMQPQNAMVVPIADSRDQSMTSSPAPVAVMVCFLSMAGFFFSPLLVWFVLVTYSPAKSKVMKSTGAEDGDEGEGCGCDAGTRQQLLLDSECARDDRRRQQQPVLYLRESELSRAARFFFFILAQAGPEGDVTGKVVGTREPAWPARDPPRSTSPTDLQSHSGAEPGLPPLAYSPCHSHQHVNTSEPPHIPPVDLESLHIFEGLEGLEHLDAGYDFWTWWTRLMSSNEDLCLDSDAGDMECF